jgi:hypothetical protein
MASFGVAFGSLFIGASTRFNPSRSDRDRCISPHGQIGTRAPKGFPELDPTGAMSQPPTNDCSGARTYPRLRHGCRGQQLTETIVRSFSLQQGQGVETESMPRSLTRCRDSVAVDTPRRVNRTATGTNMPNNYRGCLLALCVRETTGDSKQTTFTGLPSSDPPSLCSSWRQCKY